MPFAYMELLCTRAESILSWMGAAQLQLGKRSSYIPLPGTRSGSTGYVETDSIGHIGLLGSHNLEQELNGREGAGTHE